MKPVWIEACPQPGHCPGVYVATQLPADHPQFGKSVPCVCARQAQAAKLQRALPPLLRGMTFERFEVDDVSRKASQMAQKFAADPWQARPFLTLMGLSQRGKTHLALSIANALLARGEPVYVENVPVLLDQLRGGYEDGRFAATFVRVKSAPILVLDDLGAEGQGNGVGDAYAATWAQDKLYQIIDHRMVQQLPTIVTTNLTHAQLPARVAARLWNPRQAVVVAIAAGK